jgi:hypothetical protein
MNTVTLEQLGEKLDTLLAATPKRPVLNVNEACAFVGKPSVQAFAAWRKRYQVPACGHGRFSTLALTNGMNREARKTYQHGL